MSKGRGGKNKTPEKEVEAWVRAVVPLLEKGIALKTACRSLLIPYSTMRDKIKASIEIRAEIRQARAKYFEALEDVVYKGALEDPKLALDLLQRRDKKRYSIRSEITGDKGAPIITPTVTVKFVDGTGRE